MIILPAMIEGIRTRKDNTIAISIACNELTPQKAGEVMTMHGKMASVAIKVENFVQSELDMLDTLKVDESVGKSYSQRLRGVLHVLWTEQPEGYKDFPTFYASRMERLIEQIKDKFEK
jgi:hypothetical protein